MKHELFEVISFDITGKIAHFRKYYTNNTALSFSIPPRTSIMGMLAAIRGLKKDSYYELFSSENIDIGVAVLTKIKKTIHRINLLKIESISDFRGKSGRTQVPYEVVTGEDIKKTMVTYRIFLRRKKMSLFDFEQLKSAIQSRNNQYALSLGAANFNANILNYKEYQAIERCAQDELELFYSAINADDVEEIKLLKDRKGHIAIVEEELMPADFVANDNRMLQKMNRMLFSLSESPLIARLKESAKVIELFDEMGNKNIQFMM